MKVIGIIPARYGSSRFPGKPLIDLKGKSMIQRVYEGVQKSTLLSEVIVATDDLDLKGKIVDVIETGYLLHDKVIRFAKVVIGN